MRGECTLEGKGREIDVGQNERDSGMEKGECVGVCGGVGAGVGVCVGARAHIFVRLCVNSGDHLCFKCDQCPKAKSPQVHPFNWKCESILSPRVSHMLCILS